MKIPVQPSHHQARYAVACIAVGAIFGVGSHGLVQVASATTLPTLANLKLGLNYAASQAENYGMAPAPATTSRYMSTTDTSVTYNEGCAQGAANEQGEIILDFGKPWFDGSSYGTVAFDGNFRSTTDIENAVINFAYGYWSCSGPHTFIDIGIGTSNCYEESDCRVDSSTPDYTGYNHGNAWHTMVNDVWNVINAEGWYQQENVHGASDMELAWDTPANTVAWANGFSANCCGSYYDYGDANSCPPIGSCLSPWTPEDLFQVTWGVAAAYATPEVYGSGQAQEWGANAVYGVQQHGQLMKYAASFTEWNAQHDCTCTNTPDQGNQQLDKQLASHSETQQEQVLDETDITWTN